MNKICIWSSWNDTNQEEPKYLEKNMFLYHYIHCKPHVDHPRIETQPPVRHWWLATWTMA